MVETNPQKIKRLKREIEDLKEDRQEYYNMNSKINKAISELDNARENIKIAYENLEENCASKKAEGKVKELKDERKNIRQIKRELEETVLPESNYQISLINRKIKQKEKEIEDLLPRKDEIFEKKYF